MGTSRGYSEDTAGVQSGYSRGTVRVQQGTAGWGQCKRTSKQNHLTRITCVALL